MTFAHRLGLIRKQKKIRQTDLGKLVGTSGDIIGKYERGENIPSIIVAAKIADAFGITLDYLVRDTKYESIDEEALKKIKEIQKLSPDNKKYVYALLDAFIKQVKIKKII
ncbi:MAG: helix-turn-helix domain-containing protein [Candidatus Thorarchaeota archaeon]